MRACCRFQPKKRAQPPRREPDSNASHKAIVVTRDSIRPSGTPAAHRQRTGTRAQGLCVDLVSRRRSGASRPTGHALFPQANHHPCGVKISKASFTGTADNSFTLFINGKEAGHGDNSPEGWRNPVELDVTASWIRPLINSPSPPSMVATSPTLRA